MNLLFLDIETAGRQDAVDLLPEVSAAKNLKDPVKIQKALEEKRLNQRAKMALDPDYGQITAIGYHTDKESDAVVANGEVNERALLLEACGLIKWADYVITFNGKSFDMPYLWTRAMHLGVKMPYTEPDCNKYRDVWHIDLALRLTFRGVLAMKKLSQYAKVYGVPHNDSLSGADMPALWVAGEYDKIAEHVADDVKTLAALWNKLGLQLD